MMEEFIVPVQAFPIPVVVSLILAILFAIVSTRIRFRIGLIFAVCIPVLFLTVTWLAHLLLRYHIPVMEFLAVFCPAALIAVAGKGVYVEEQASWMQETNRALLAVLRRGNAFTVPHLALELDVSFEKAEQIVREFVKSGIAERDPEHGRADNVPVYRIKRP